MNGYAYVPNPLTWVDPLGLSGCPGQALKSIDVQLARGKNAQVTVKDKATAEDVLRAYTSGPNHHGSYMDTTAPGTFSPKADASDWLPRPTSSKRGTYHWDDYNPNAKMGDHASVGAHLQLHTFDGKIIRIFF